MNLLVSLNFWILFLLFVNCPQVLHVNLGCLKCISGINLSPPNKKLFPISFILYLVLTCLMLLKQKRTYWRNLKDVFIPKIHNNPLNSCCLINFDFFYYHTLHILIKALFFRVLTLQHLDFCFLYLFYTSNIVITLFYVIID